MESNSFILYGNITEVYDKLISFCSLHGFTVKETKEKYISITARKTSVFFWRRLQLEIKILVVEKKKVELSIFAYKYGKRSLSLETQYRIAIDNFLSSTK